MAYSELIKNFSKIREYMREFYVYGFKSREEIGNKSARSYDDERRRIESWLGDYMRFNSNSNGKNVFISIDSRNVKHNPLYKAWKTKSFTDGDITLHFILFDILCVPGEFLSLREIQDELYDYLDEMDSDRLFDESTIRKKLKEYISEGLVVSVKEGKTVKYSRSDSLSYDALNGFSDCLNFFSEVSPCGVIGSFINDKLDDDESVFNFKHHYITAALDSEVMECILEALGSSSKLTICKKNDKSASSFEIVPVRIYVSVQTGRQYLMAYDLNTEKFLSVRIDSIDSCKTSGVIKNIDEYKCLFDKEIAPYLWGVSLHNYPELEKVEFVLKYEEDEYFIPQRLLREKRNGTVTRIDDTHSKFETSVFDSRELFPWIRTFIGRIESISFSNEELQELFIKDLFSLIDLYDEDGGAV